MVGLLEFAYESATGVRVRLLAEAVLVAIVVAAGVFTGRPVSVGMIVAGDRVGEAASVGEMGLAVTGC